MIVEYPPGTRVRLLPLGILDYYEFREEFTVVGTTFYGDLILRNESRAEPVHLDQDLVERIPPPLILLAEAAE